MSTDVLCTRTTFYLQTNEHGEAVVRIPREMLEALRLESGDPLDLAARYQSFSGQWELLLIPCHCLIGRTMPYRIGKKNARKHWVR